MESKDFNETLINYLYGEMNQSEKKKFEQKMADDPALREEVENLKTVRGDLGMLEDKEVMEPFSIWEHARSASKQSTQNRRQQEGTLLRPITAIAASLLLLMVVGFATNFSLSLNKEGFQISFHKGEDGESQPMLTEDDIKRMLVEEIQKNNGQLLTSLDESGDAANTRLAKLEKAIQEAQSANSHMISKEELDQFVADLENRNGLLLQDYLSQASSQQQAYFKTMLTQFSEYLQDQRVEDLNMIQSELLQLNYTQTQQKMATDEVLAGLITRVNNKQN